MAKIFQIVESEDDSLLNEWWHVAVSYPWAHTVCGVQLEGDDGVVAGKEKNGIATCPVCIGIIEEIKAIRNWR